MEPIDVVVLCVLVTEIVMFIATLFFTRWQDRRRLQRYYREKEAFIGPLEPVRRKRRPPLRVVH